MYRLDYEYTDAKMHKHKMCLKCDNLEESQIIWETLVMVLTDMRKNGTLTRFSGFMDCSRNEVK